MKHNYYVCAAVSTADSPNRIINTSVSIEHDNLANAADISKMLCGAIPQCQAVLNYWEYGYENSSTAYTDAKLYVNLIVGELYVIAEDTKDKDTKERLHNLLDGLDTPKITRRFEGRVSIED